MILTLSKHIVRPSVCSDSDIHSVFEKWNSERNVCNSVTFMFRDGRISIKTRVRMANICGLVVLVPAIACKTTSLVDFNLNNFYVTSPDTASKWSWQTTWGIFQVNRSNFQSNSQPSFPLPSFQLTSVSQRGRKAIILTSRINLAKPNEVCQSCGLHPPTTINDLALSLLKPQSNWQYLMINAVIHESQ